MKSAPEWTFGWGRSVISKPGVTNISHQSHVTFILKLVLATCADNQQSANHSEKCVFSQPLVRHVDDFSRILLLCGATGENEFFYIKYYVEWGGCGRLG